MPELPPGPLQTNVLEPTLIQLGLVAARPAGTSADEELADEDDFLDAEVQDRPPTFPEMLKMVFESRLAAPEPVFVQPKWIGGGVAEAGGDFYRFVKSCELVKQEGLILRHLLRLTILAGEMATLTQDPDYTRIGEIATNACSGVDPRYTARFLEQAEAAKKMATV